MTKISPSIPGSHIIRTYPKDYADTDTESEGESQIDVDPEDEEQESTSARLQQNQQFMDRQITSGETSAWILETQNWKATEVLDVVLIRKPTASNLSHRLLNPYIYRNIQNVGSLHDLATLLNTPDNWENMYANMVENGRILRMLNRFRALPDDTAESTIQSQFISLVSAIANTLGVDLDSDSENKIIVGGMLARYQYDLRSKTDPRFLNPDGLVLLASEAKTHRTFAPGEMWYHGSRGIQVLSALYAFNCPIFLFTQKQWKLLVENTDRNSVLTFPYDDDIDHTAHVNSSLVQPMGTTFVKTIVICLLSKRTSFVESIKSISVEESSVMETPKKTVVKPKYFHTTEKPQRKSARLSKTSGMDSGKPIPSFISEYVDGSPVYRYIRIVSDEVVSTIEAEIALKEKMEYKHETSESALLQ